MANEINVSVPKDNAKKFSTRITGVSILTEKINLKINPIRIMSNLRDIYF